MYSHIIELTPKPGQARDLVNAIRDQAIPQVIRPSAGFVDEIVLLSDTDPNHVTRSSTQEGPVVGTASAILYCRFQDQLNVIPTQTTGSVFSFHDLQGRSLGSLCANMVEGRAFRTYLPGAPYPVFRMGGFGPLLCGTGAFAGVSGMMSMNGVISASPPILSNLYVLRIEDSAGRLRSGLPWAH